jgi:hypothetical protein
MSLICPLYVTQRIIRLRNVFQMFYDPSTGKGAQGRGTAAEPARHRGAACIWPAAGRIAPAFSRACALLAYIYIYVTRGTGSVGRGAQGQ